LAARGAWLRGNLSVDQLTQMLKLPDFPEGLPLTDYQSKTLLALGRQISERNGERLASYDPTFRRSPPGFPWGFLRGELVTDFAGPARFCD